MPRIRIRHPLPSNFAEEICEPCDGRGKFTFLRIPNMVIEEHRHFGCRGTGLTRDVEFFDIPSIDPPIGHDVIRGSVWSGGVRLATDCASGEIVPEVKCPRFADMVVADVRLSP